MKAGDGSGAHGSSRESWLSAPLSDPNAALWASITPPANPNLSTTIRRRAASFSLDLLAQRLHLRFPEHFASRSTARVAILGAAVVFGAAAGVFGYFATGRVHPASVARSAVQQDTVAAAASLHRSGVAGDAERLSIASAQRASAGQTALDAPLPNAPPTLAATAPSDAIEQIVQPLRPSADAAELEVTTSAKAKRAASKKRSLATARRAAKSRRARATVDEGLTR